ncbi:MAG: hypothetical protein EHM19_13800 [Candidatus Latescibacterota bacterium]|nr:MAG: hypothetical protein EHM19_13800 [Candidatus Latescibacterota bacterium]
MPKSTIGLSALVFLLLCGPYPAEGKSEEGVSLRYGGGDHEVSHALLAECHFQKEDLALGATYRYAILPQRFLGFFLHGSVRPYYDARIEEVRPGYHIVFDEFRWLIAAGLEEELPLTSHIGLFAGGGGGYTFGDYEATSRAPEEGWTPLAQAGVSVRGRIDEGVEGMFRAGYRYIDLRGDDRNWWYAALGAAF